MPRKTFWGYYTSAEVMQRLGITQEMLYTYVRSGRLTKVIPPGRKQAVYDKKQVDELVAEMEEFLVVSDRMPAIFSKARPEDMDDLAKLINALFDHWPNVEYWKEYLRRNPDIGYLLRVEDQIVGCAFIFPLPANRIADILSYEGTPAPILPEEIHPYVPGVPYHLYIRSVGILPRISKIDKRIWGARLLSHLRTVFVDFGKRGIDVRTIWSRSNTVDGIRILRHLGFTEVPSSTTSHNFLIDVKYSGLPIIQQYKDALIEWKSQTQEGRLR